MSRIIVIITILGFTHLLSAQVKNFIDQPYIETSATVDTLVTPDKIYMEIILDESDTKGKESLEELEKRLSVTLESLGLDIENNLKLKDLSSNYHKYIFRSQDIQKKKTYEMLVSTAETASKVMFALEKAGISNVRITYTEYTDLQNMKLALSIEAVKRAKLQAEKIAIALNRTLGNVIHVSDVNVNIFNRELSGTTTGIFILGEIKTKDRQEVYPTIEFEKMKIEASVSVTFTID